MTAPEHQRPPHRRGEFIERLAIFLMGIAIGLALLGMIWMGRHRAAQVQDEQIRQQQEQQQIERERAPG